MVLEAPFLLFLSLQVLPTHGVSEQTKGAKEPSSTFLEVIVASSPDATSCPSPHLSTKLLTILGHRPILQRTHRYPWPTIYKISLF